MPRLVFPSSTVRATEPSDVRKVGADLVALAHPPIAGQVADVGDGAALDGVEAAPSVDSAGVALPVEPLDGPVGAPPVQAVAPAGEGLVLTGLDAGDSAEHGGVPGGDFALLLGAQGGRDELVDRGAVLVDVDGVDAVSLVGWDGEALVWDGDAGVGGH